jgi:hypothetical protein
VLTEAELHPVGIQRLPEHHPEAPRFAGQHVIAAFDERRRTTHPHHGLRHLHPHWAATQHQHPAGHLRHAGDVAAGPQSGQPAQAGDRRDERVGSRGQDDDGGGVGGAVDQPPGPAVEPAVTPDEIDACARGPRGRGGVVVGGDHDVAPRERRRDVDSADDDLCRSSPQ